MRMLPAKIIYDSSKIIMYNKNIVERIFKYPVYVIIFTEEKENEGMYIDIAWDIISSRAALKAVVINLKNYCKERGYKVKVYFFLTKEKLVSFLINRLNFSWGFI